MGSIAEKESRLKKTAGAPGHFPELLGKVHFKGTTGNSLGISKNAVNDRIKRISI